MSDTRQEFLHNSGANIFYSEYFLQTRRPPPSSCCTATGRTTPILSSRSPPFPRTSVWC